MSAVTELITYYLEMKAAPAFVSSSTESCDFQLIECRRAQPQFNEFLYRLVGQAWDWTDRLAWSRQQWLELVQSDDLRTWVAYVDGAIAGYFELRKENLDVEILYFGLAQEFIGQGLGRPLLEQAIRSAWEWGAVERVWVHTCNLDHPSALTNYKKRGFELYKTTTEPV